MAEKNKISQRKRGKLQAEIGSEPQVVKEYSSIKEKKNYQPKYLVMAIEDLSLKINNAFFRHPFNRCPDCIKKGNNEIMGHFGLMGSNKLGNLNGFDATIGDVIAWYSNTYKGISIVKSKCNGIFELETSPFEKPLKEPAIIEKMLIPLAYQPMIEEMADFLANNEITGDDKSLVQIGKRKYPDVIAKKL